MEVELNEEQNISNMYESSAKDIPPFDRLESVCGDVFSSMQQKAADFLKLQPNENVTLQYPELMELKGVKGKKVFCGADSEGFVASLFNAVAKQDNTRIVKLIEENPAKYLVYSTYAIQYISRITTTYGDYMDNTIFVNKFILKRYPVIILSKMANTPANHSRVQSGYVGAVKMTILEECIHSMQEALYRQNRQAAIGVNTINESLAQTVLDLDSKDVGALSEYLKLQPVPDDFPFAQKANLFFFLNPDHFLAEQMGPDIMTFSRVSVDPNITKYIPDITKTYIEWLPHIQKHHTAFTVMEGMAAYALKHLLQNDENYAEYQNTFTSADTSSYQVRKDLGMNFVEYVADKTGNGCFASMLDAPPSTFELKDPTKYVQRVGS